MEPAALPPSIDETSADSEARYRGLLEAAPDAMVVVDQRGMIVLLNVQAEKQFGYRRDELLGQRVTAIIPEGFAERLIADDLRSAEEALAQQIGTGIELSGRRRNGEAFPIEIMLSPLKSAEGILVTAAIRDISVRKEADRHLAQMEARYRGLLEAAPDAMVVVNEAGTIVLVNMQAEQRFGYDRAELIGQSIELLVPHRLLSEHAEHRAGYAEAPRIRAMGNELQLSGRRKNGTEFPIEIMLSPLDSPEGLLVTATVRDISARVAAEEEHRRLSSAVEQTADSISMHGLDGIITYVNSAFTRAYGYEPEEIVGRYGGIIDSGRHDPSFFVGIRALAAAGRNWTGTIVNRRKDGSPIEVEAVISAIRDAEGRVVSYVQADRDVTRERELEGALERNARERGGIETALAQIDPAASAEVVAAAACAVINELPGIDSTWAGVLDGNTGTVLAATGQLAPTFAAGRPIPASRVAYLCDRGAGGPWFEEWHPRTGDAAWLESVTSTGLRAMAYAPLRGPHGLVGIVGIGSHDPVTALSLVEHVPALATFASILGAQLAPKLERRRSDALGKSVIRSVIDRSAFSPFFQPIVNLDTGAVVGYEALTRFTDGVPPDARFAAAANAGLGIELETATLQTALKAAASVLPGDAYLSLNASPALINSGSLQPLLAGSGRPIVIEITEHIPIDDYAALRARLTALGPTVRLAVDDAGAGYASFRHILELAPDLVKLDIGLIRGIDGDPARQALISGMAYFAMKRKISLIAEGVETIPEFEALRSLAIRLGQGYLFGRPRDARGGGAWPTVLEVAS